MGEMTWQHWFEIGHDTIDFEHKVFFTLIHKLQAVVSGGGDREEIRRSLAEIIKYAEFHFLSEENIMIECDYPGLEKHRKIHEEIMHKLREEASLFDAGVDNATEMVKFLFEWLLRHTVTEDIAISKSVKEKNLKQLFSSD